eukprot:830933-Prymnesium_polylepis.2
MKDALPRNERSAYVIVWGVPTPLYVCRCVRGEPGSLRPSVRWCRTVRLYCFKARLDAALRDTLSHSSLT